jgi:PilZ domain
MSSPSSERRRARRAVADFPIQIDPGKGTAPARLKDLSAIGLCCTTSAELAEMTRVGIDLQLPGQSRRHQLLGAEVRCEKLSSPPGQYEIAVYFTDMDPVAKAAVGAWVENGTPA